MLKTIHKYPLTESFGPGFVHIAIKGFHRWVSAGLQHDRIVMWAEVFPDSEQYTDLKVYVAWTGQDFNIDTDGRPFEHLITLTSSIGIVNHIYVQKWPGE